MKIETLAARTGEWLRFLIAGVVLISVYESLGGIIHALGAPLQDAAVIAADRMLTGGRVPPLAIWPWPAPVVDAFAAAYVAFFVLPIALVVLLLRQGNPGGARSAVLTMLIAFYLHYFVYLVMPVVGPLRSVDVPAAARTALAAEGGAFTHMIRAGIAAAEKTPQDGFPSAHTSVAWLVAMLARKYRLRSRRLFVLMAIAVTASTLVLGYHYLVDVIAAWPMASMAWGMGGRCPVMSARSGKSGLQHGREPLSRKRELFFYDR